MADSTADRKVPGLLEAKAFLRSDCPLACALDVIGDKWTMLILRDLFSGKARYNELLGSDEKIPSNILAARLRHLTEAGLVSAEPYQERPRRLEYRLTESGQSLAPVVIALAQWGASHIPGTRRSRLPTAKVARRPARTARG